MTSQDVVQRALDMLLAQDMAGFAGLWATDGVLEFPFAAPGYPTRLEGRSAIAEYMRGYPDLLRIEAFPRQVLHQSVDPAVVIAEFEASGTVVATGVPYLMRYIAVITVRDNEIELYRDYWSPAAAADVMGDGLDVLGASGVSAHE